MRDPVVVVDTNVVVSGLLTDGRDAPTARILSALLSGEMRFLLSVEQLAEYRTVLLRPAIRTRHGRRADEIDVLLAALVARAILREPGAAEPPLPPDDGDRHLWALVRALPGAILVTGDRGLFDAPDPGFSVLAPAALLALLRRGESEP